MATLPLVSIDGYMIIKKLVYFKEVVILLLPNINDFLIFVIIIPHERKV